MATTEAPATTAPAGIWSRTSGGYGRPARMLRTAAMREVAILVTLPKGYFEEYGARYMVTDRRPGAAYSDPDVTTTWYFATRACAVAQAETLLPAWPRHHLRPPRTTSRQSRPAMTSSTIILSPIRVRELVGEYRACCVAIEWNNANDQDTSAAQTASVLMRHKVAEQLRAGGHGRLAAHLSAERRARVSVRVRMADQGWRDDLDRRPGRGADGSGGGPRAGEGLPGGGAGLRLTSPGFQY